MFKGVRINNSFRDRFQLSWLSKLRYNDYKWHTQRCLKWTKTTRVRSQYILPYYNKLEVSKSK